MLEFLFQNDETISKASRKVVFAALQGFFNLGYAFQTCRGRGSGQKIPAC